jgi:hypothetical protein
MKHRWPHSKTKSGYPSHRCSAAFQDEMIR